MADDTAGAPHISIAAGVTVGLVASLVQSLGLTVQRLSHVANERLPPSDRKRDWQRPLWLGGFAIFILSNVFGTLFQIGALPIVVLGPLGAVSLLWNALFARVILGDEFSVHLIVGTILIACGAVLIGIFGVVPEVTHTLPELVALYRRPPFVLWVSFLALSLALVLAAAHVAEWRMHRRLERLPPGTPRTPRAWAAAAAAAAGKGRKGMMNNRRWSAPVVGGHEGEWTGSPEMDHPPAGVKVADYGAAAHVDERAPLLPQHHQPPSSKVPTTTKHARFAFPSLSPSPTRKSRPPSLDLSPSALPPFESPSDVLAGFERTRLWLAVAYGATSGTLSGLCLLFTKTGIELLILTVTGRGNQFGHLEPWLIILTLLLTELFQLSYLNRALRLSGPTLVCPLAFCFYNTSSIVSGLVYYRQVDALPGWKMALVAGGCGVLLAGVWVVSIQTEGKCKEGGKKAGQREVCDEPEEEEEGLLSGEGEVDSTDEEEEPAPYRPRGFSIGLGAASPGFDIHPRSSTASSHPLRRPRTSTFPSSSSLPSFPRPAAAEPSSPTERTPLAASTGSLPPQPPQPPSTPKRHHHHRRSESLSLSGAPYVGSPTHGHSGGGGHKRTLSGDLRAHDAEAVGEGVMEGLGLREVDVGDSAVGKDQAGGKKGRGWWRRFLPL
ncbi:hypothetical protein JCM6882_003196 [Rhodosporidiobolus microsporus]